MAKRFSSIFAVLFCLLFVSCYNKNSGSIGLDVSNFFTLLSKDSPEKTEKDNNYTINLKVIGDFSYDYNFSGKLNDFKDKKINIEHIPLGSDISILVNILKNNELYYSGTSNIHHIEPGPNSLNLKMQKVKNSSEKKESSMESRISSPIITVTCNNEDTRDGKLVFNSESEVLFTVSGVTPYPENTLYSWFINGEQVFSELGEAYSASTLPIDFSQNPDFDFENKITVWVYYEDIMKTANVDFLFTDSR